MADPDPNQSNTNLPESNFIDDFDSDTELSRFFTSEGASTFEFQDMSERKLPHFLDSSVELESKTQEVGIGFSSPWTYVNNILGLEQKYVGTSDPVTLHDNFPGITNHDNLIPQTSTVDSYIQKILSNPEIDYNFSSDQDGLYDEFSARYADPEPGGKQITKRWLSVFYSMLTGEKPAGSETVGLNSVKLRDYVSYYYNLVNTIAAKLKSGLIHPEDAKYALRLIGGQETLHIPAENLGVNTVALIESKKIGIPPNIRPNDERWKKLIKYFSYIRAKISSIHALIENLVELIDFYGDQAIEQMESKEEEANRAQQAQILAQQQNILDINNQQRVFSAGGQLLPQLPNPPGPQLSSGALAGSMSVDIGGSSISGPSRLPILNIKQVGDLASAMSSENKEAENAESYKAFVRYKKLKNSGLLTRQQYNDAKRIPIATPKITQKILAQLAKEREGELKRSRSPLTSPPKTDAIDENKNEELQQPADQPTPATIEVSETSPLLPADEKKSEEKKSEEKKGGSDSSGGGGNNDEGEPAAPPSILGRLRGMMIAAGGWVTNKVQNFTLTEVTNKMRELFAGPQNQKRKCLLLDLLGIALISLSEFGIIGSKRGTALTLGLYHFVARKLTTATRNIREAGRLDPYKNDPLQAFKDSFMFNLQKCKSYPIADAAFAAIINKGFNKNLPAFDIWRPIEFLAVSTFQNWLDAEMKNENILWRGDEPEEKQLGNKEAMAKIFAPFESVSSSYVPKLKQILYDSQVDEQARKEQMEREEAEEKQSRRIYQALLNVYEPTLNLVETLIRRGWSTDEKELSQPFNQRFPGYGVNERNIYQIGKEQMRGFNREDMNLYNIMRSRAVSGRAPHNVLRDEYKTIIYSDISPDTIMGMSYIQLAQRFPEMFAFSGRPEVKDVVYRMLGVDPNSQQRQYNYAYTGDPNAD
jgi:hypothetical protein